MGIEAGLINLANLSISSATSPPASFTAGYWTELPKNQTYPAYTLRWISEPQNLSLLTNRDLKYARVEFRVYGDPSMNGGDAIAISNAISTGLHGFMGVLTDPDATRVSSIHKTDQMDLSIDPETRAYRRMIEFTVNYY